MVRSPAPIRLPFWALFATLLPAPTSTAAERQPGSPALTLCVVDPSGLPLPQAAINELPTSQTATGQSLPGQSLPGSTHLLAKTGPDGCALLPPGIRSGSLLVVAAGFAPAVVSPPVPGPPERVTLQPASAPETVTVTADRGLPGVDDRSASTLTLTGAQLAAPPALALDDRLHQVAGFQLYRRTSSWTANPTTEGVSLRGLGSTAASRTLAVSDEVPLNDPFGGWIHWDEIPALAIASVELERGGATDLYGSGAIGGVIAIDPVTPSPLSPITVAADALGATENSASADLLVTGATPEFGWLLAGGGVDTGGYIPTAPAARGLVDTPANVAEGSGRAELSRTLRSPRRSSARTVGGALFLRGNVLNEARQNGTPDQTNGTRLWRYEAGGDADTAHDHAALRLFGARETYRQSFSSIAPNRNTEIPTRQQRVPVDELGFSLTASRALPHALSAALGLDTRDIRATDAESPIAANVITSTVSTSAHQRDIGGYAEGIWQPRNWSLAASVRADSFRTFDGRQTSTATPVITAEPSLSELLASPHAGIVRTLPHGVALMASGFRAFRGPTMNELYRTGQVGSQTTLANPSLRAERATGFETGVELTNLSAAGHPLGSLRASYFWTEVNRPVSAVTLSQTASTQTLQRQNLGQIRSRGLSLDAISGRWHSLDAAVGYQLAVATVTAFITASPVQANLTGKWIPEVPRQMLTATLNGALPRCANFHFFASYTGQSFDDASNQFLLHPYARFDLSADRAILTHTLPGLSVFAAAQNLLNRRIDAGRTPVLTIAAPRLVQAGLRYTFHR